MQLGMDALLRQMGMQIPRVTSAGLVCSNGELSVAAVWVRLLLNAVDGTHADKCGRVRMTGVCLSVHNRMQNRCTIVLLREINDKSSNPALLYPRMKQALVSIFEVLSDGAYSSILVVLVCASQAA
jgi:hypothetical protein